MLTSLHPYDQVICIGLDSSPGPDWPSVLAGAVHWRRTPALRLRSGPPCWGRLPQPAGWTPPELLLAPCRRTSERYARLGPAHLDLPDQYRGGNLMTTPSSLYAMKPEQRPSVSVSQLHVIWSLWCFPVTSWWGILCSGSWVRICFMRQLLWCTVVFM